MEKQVDITEARKHLADLVNHVKYQGDHYIIARRGEPTAALVPLSVLEEWKRERDKLFEVIREVQEKNAGADPEQVMADVLEAQQAVRSQSSQST